MECINQELDQFLHLFINERQDDWYDLLPIAEFQHNNHVHSAMQQPLCSYWTWDKSPAWVSS